MINLSHALRRLDLAGTDLDAGRVESVLRHLRLALNSNELQIEEQQVPLLQELLRAHLKQARAAPATVTGQVYRLGKLLKLTMDQGLLPPPSPTFDPRFPSLPTPPNKPSRRRQTGIRIFREWCVDRRISFDQINEATLREYREALRSDTTRHNLARAQVLYSDLLAGWKENAREGRFPALAAPRWNDASVSRYGLARDQWPPLVEEDFARLERGARNGARAGEKRWNRPLRDTSLEVYQGELELLLGYVANVRSEPLEGKSLLHFLGDGPLVLDFIQWHRDQRCDGEERAYHRDWLGRFASMLDWLDGEASTVDRYKSTAASLVPKRVREPFPTRPIEYEEFVDAASRVTGAAIRRWELASCGESVGERKRAACALRDAVCFSLLVCRPLRSRNVREMRLKTNLRKGPEGTWRLRFDDLEMKTSSYECAFPSVVVDALELYLDAARPALCGSSESQFVFPSRSGKKLRSGDLWRKMTRLGRKTLDASTNPHLFRYLVPCAYLLRYPERLVEVQALLGHKNLAVTLRCYVHVYGQVASRRVAELQRLNCPSMRQLGELFPAA